MPQQKPAPAWTPTHPLAPPVPAGQSAIQKDGGWPALPRSVWFHPACPCQAVRRGIHGRALPAPSHSAVAECWHPASAKPPFRRRSSSPLPVWPPVSALPPGASAASAKWVGDSPGLLHPRAGSAEYVRRTWSGRVQSAGGDARILPRAYPRTWRKSRENPCEILPQNRHKPVRLLPPARSPERVLPVLKGSQRCAYVSGRIVSCVSVRTNKLTHDRLARILLYRRNGHASSHLTLLGPSTITLSQ